MVRLMKPPSKKSADPAKDWTVVEEHDVDAFGVVLIEENGHGERRAMKGTNRDCGEHLDAQLAAAKERRRALRAERMRVAEELVETLREKYRLGQGREMTEQDLARELKLTARATVRRITKPVNELMARPPRRPKRERVDPMDDGEGEAFVRLNGGDER